MAGIQDISALVADKLELTHKAGRETVEAVLDALTELTDAGESVSVRGFGTFKLKTTAARVCKNPQTGEPVQVPAKTKLTFKAAK